jgi:hypothetical protein
MDTFDLSNQIKVLNPCANNDYLYGPYNSLDEAINTITTPMLTVGRTIGIIESGVIKEYWYQHNTDTDKYEFVEKNDHSTKSIITSTCDVGAINEGEDIPVGTTLTDLINLLTQKPKTPNQISPIEAYLSSSIMGTVETGSTINPVLECTFYDGTVETYGKDVMDPSSVFYGCEEDTFSYYRTCGGREECVQGSGTSEYTDKYSIGDETITYHAIVKHTEPTAKPLDSKGNVVDFSKIEGAPVDPYAIKTNVVEITGSLQYFAQAYDTRTAPPTEEQIRETMNTTQNWIIDAINDGISVSETSTRGVIVAIPEEYEILSVTTDAGINITSSFSSYTTVEIEDAGGNKHNYKKYNKWTTGRANRDLQIKIGKIEVV